MFMNQDYKPQKRIYEIDPEKMIYEEANEHSKLDINVKQHFNEIERRSSLDVGDHMFEKKQSMPPVHLKSF